jgi:hypothetical protein
MEAETRIHHGKNGNGRSGIPRFSGYLAVDGAESQSRFAQSATGRGGLAAISWFFLATAPFCVYLANLSLQSYLSAYLGALPCSNFPSFSIGTTSRATDSKKQFPCFGSISSTSRPPQYLATAFSSVKTESWNYLATSGLNTEPTVVTTQERHEMASDISHDGLSRRSTFSSGRDKSVGRI